MTSSSNEFQSVDSVVRPCLSTEPGPQYEPAPRPRGLGHQTTSQALTQWATRSSIWPTNNLLPELFHFCLSMLSYPSTSNPNSFPCRKPLSSLSPVKMGWFPYFASPCYHLPYFSIHSVMITQHPLHRPSPILRSMATVLKKAQFLLWELIFKWMIQTNSQKQFHVKCNLMVWSKIKLGRG